MSLFFCGKSDFDERRFAGTYIIMNMRISFVVLLQVLFFCGSGLFQSALGSTPVTVILNPKQVVAAGIASIRNIKTVFQLELSGERTSRNQLFSAYNGFDNSFFKTLQNGLFNIEEAKANSILNVLRGSPDLYCTTHLKRIINDIRDKEAKKVFNFCAAEIDALVTGIKQVLSSGQTFINSATSTGEVVIRKCESIYILRQNITQLNVCIAEAESSVRSVASRFESLLTNRTSEKIVNLLANCTDKTIVTVNTALNLNYDSLVRCLNTSSNNGSRQLAAVISTSYKLNLTSNEVRDVAAAIANLKANPSATIEKVDSVKAKVEVAVNNRNRNNPTLKEELIATNEDVIKYRNAFVNASFYLNTIPGARRCVINGQNQIQTIINTNTNNLKSCLNSIQLTTSVAEVNRIGRLVTDRKNIEGFVAITNCLANEGGLYQNRTIVCSVQADSTFVNFLGTFDLELSKINQMAEAIQTLVSKCESSIVSTIKANLYANELTFNNCLITTASIKFSLF